MKSALCALALGMMGLTVGLAPVLAGTEPLAADAPDTPANSAKPGETNHLDKGRRIGFNFLNADVDAVLAYLSKVAGVTFIKHTPVSGEVTIVNQEQLTIAAAFTALNSALKSKGVTCIVNDSRMVKIVPLSEAKHLDVKVYTALSPDELPTGETIITQVVRLKRARARDMATTLSKLLGAYGDLSAAVQGNVLIITDTANNVRRLMEIIQEADTDPQALADLRVFVLTNADARIVAQIIERVFAQQQARRGQPQAVFSFRGRTVTRGGSRGGATTTGTGSPTEDAAIPVRVTVEERLNAVIVIAGADQMKQIEALVIKLDVLPDRAQTVVEVVVLKNGECTEMAKTLEGVFERRTSGSSRSSRGSSSSTVPQPTWQRGRRGGGSTGSTSSTESGPSISDVELNVATDRRTNAIVLTGTREQVDVAVEIINRLTAEVGEQMDMLLIELKNSKAQDVERALRQIFREANQATQRLAGGTGRGSTRGTAQTASQVAAPGLAGETIVVADETANTLLIVSNPRNFDRIKEYVAKLDKPKPQVFIQVIIGEITLDDDTKLGLDFSYLDDPFRHGSGTAQWRMDFGVAADLSGGSVALTYRDIELVVRALQMEGKLHVISRPYVLTRDNQTARIADAERTPFIRESRTTTEGTTLNTIQYEDVGIILQVTPQINQDGYVNMVIEQEISRITGRTVPVSETVDAPTFSTRSVRTNVSIRDGQTIIIGGTISESEVSTIEEVPILGQLPIIGYAFRSSVVTIQRKELVLFLTPHVVRDDEDLETVSAKRREKSAFKEADKEDADLGKKHADTDEDAPKP